LRNGLSNPRIDPRSTIAAIRHPRWLREFVIGGPIRSAHLLDDTNNRSVSLFRSPGFLQRRMDPTATWDEVSWIRSIWKGPLVIKGILTTEDARSCFERGADAIVCSNHGGRVLDGNPATLTVLPRLVDVAESFKREVYIDGGIRTGGDVVKSLALGARACLIARPFWWGLAVAGEDGAVQVIDLLKKEIESTLTQLGRPSLAALDRAAIEEAQN
jgi:isopentenyl diphosphate isomerase/L-lactate dehydrogenase-like FMN-dependent dehydrogenase